MIFRHYYCSLVPIGATTFSIMTFRIMTLSILTLKSMPVSLTTFSKFDSEQMALKTMTLSIMAVSITTLVMKTKSVQQSVAIQPDMLSVIMPNVVVMNVEAPFRSPF